MLLLRMIGRCMNLDADLGWLICLGVCFGGKVQSDAGFIYRF